MTHLDSSQADPHTYVSRTQADPSFGEKGTPGGEGRGRSLRVSIEKIETGPGGATVIHSFAACPRLYSSGATTIC